MTISPKSDFQECSKTNGWRWNEVVTSTQFQEAAKAAMLQLVCEETQVTISDHAERSHMICGAQRYLSILMSLAESPQTPEPPKGKSLTYT